MGAEEPVVEGGNEAKAEVREGNANKKEEKEEDEAKDLEKGEVGFEERAFQTNYDNAENRHTHEDFQHSMYHRLNPTNPLRIVLNSNTRVASPSPPPPPPPSSHPRPHPHPPPPPSSHPRPHPHPPPPPSPSPSPPPESQPSEPRSVPILQPQRPVTLSSRRYTNRISLFLFLLHFFLAVVLVCFLVFKGIQGLFQASDSIKRRERRVLKFFLPQVEAACLISITLAFMWQKAIRKWPTFMVHFILWCTFVMSLAAGVLLLCFQRPSTNGVGVCLIAFSVGNGLYACWVNNRIKFCCKILSLSLEPASKFPDLNYPTYCMLSASFLWMTLWTVAVIGALNFYVPPLIIMALMLSLAWTTEVMRNVVNITVSRVIALYYLRGMQSNTKFCFLRASTRNLGSACLGSLFVPTIEALRIVARGLNLLEGEDEFMFCCAHCCLRVMESIFRNGNSWAYVQIAAYGKGFVQASQDTWALFQKEKIEQLVDSDITSSICFLTGVCSGSICVIVVAAWTAKVHQSFTARLSLLTFFVGYLLTRIAMAVPHACVSCYYACYAENPENRLFDKTIKERLELLETHKEASATTPRGRRRSLRA